MAVGKIFAAGFLPDAPLIIGAAGNRGNVNMWNLKRKMLLNRISRNRAKETIKRELLNFKVMIYKRTYALNINILFLTLLTSLFTFYL